MNKKVIQRILSYTAHYKIYILLSFLFSIVSVITTLLVPILCGQAIDHMLGAGQVELDAIICIIINLMFLIVITAISRWLQALCNNKITYGVSNELRNELIEHISLLPLEYLDKHPVGDIVSRMIADVDTFTDGLLISFTQLFTGILTIVGTLGFMLCVNFVVTIVVVILTPLSVLIAKYIAKHIYKYFTKQSEDKGKETAYVNEMIDHIQTVHTLGIEEESIHHFSELNKELEDSSLKATFYSSLINPTTRFVNNLIYAVVTLVGALFVLHKQITIGEMSVFLNYASQYAKPFNEISSVYTELQNAIACSERVFDLLDQPIISDDTVRELKASGDIDLNHVDFSYNNQPFIHDLNLHVTSGQRVAIVGKTGCGKTTLINLLMRFYDVNNGSIEVNHENIKEVSRVSLRKQYGMVLQDTWLKQGTIYENITYGKKDVTLEEVIEVAKRSKAHNFIKRLPNGYDTYILENGEGLSTGQKQLLCITRLMLENPSMLILDEATSNIDIRTEMQVQSAFDSLMEGKTTIVVAHRLSTIKNADMIVVMDQGKIVETGNHESLLKLKGYYYNLYNSQFEEA